MNLLSDRVNRLSYSQTFVMSNKARELKAQGINVISLTLGEPDFEIPEFVRESAIKAINDGVKSYTPVPGYLELRKAIANKFKRDNNLEYKPDQIVVSNGGKQSIINVLLSIINDGDEVIVPAPYWVSYYEMVKLAGGENIVVNTTIDTDFKITPEQLENAITPKTQAFLFSSPCNPSGTVYTKEELYALAKVLEKHPNVIIISDEIYEYINYEGKHESIAQFPEVFNQTVTINGVSKSYAMTGWRIGYLGGPKWLTDACDKIQGQMTSGANCIAQKASITAIEADPSVIDYMIDGFKKRRELVYNLLHEIPGFKVNKPAGAFYFFPDVSFYFGKTIQGHNITNSDDFALLLLEKAHVATVGGVCFGDSNCIRLSYAASEEDLIEALKRIKNTLS
ncbi:aminotransferase class I/II-fold pyridoxal phosphate-dependent enzyme [Apibacter sp. B3889]|uniref:pyridoxal phosphate-dependent aminotransferase n=1 Tax=unclassified Apibacter TaxID=2630820 RepID=UPI001328CA24|nr:MULTISPECIES: pyridoxal phosphate-dependent aminotransferase [unclassified Apibacter]MXO35047.1 aminotransferase class I/II-fold pyridoxal phosphate-dependent enzyme [Apibacter sp. B3883]MXO42405.1 aminotransferase class I/II-fold pyridoxal phosphate-dependent enzyme [Apibacter sp. B3889]MXP04422.1 aminotransferase class I/II-fold pyridoxal phosphate-dependent enzyme [Apibacter sp. B3887]MXP08397.1 aminotransferase class I/II-fold pyridoxal phosphate-dependent enzyme [Apibacter sp. B3935]